LRAWLTSMHWIRSNRDEAIKLTADELKVNSKTAMELINELSNSGALNIKGLDNALNLRNQFGLTPPMGPKRFKILRQAILPGSRRKVANSSQLRFFLNLERLHQ